MEEEIKDAPSDGEADQEKEDHATVLFAEIQVLKTVNRNEDAIDNINYYLVENSNKEWFKKYLSASNKGTDSMSDSHGNVW